VRFGALTLSTHPRARQGPSAFHARVSASIRFRHYERPLRATCNGPSSSGEIKRLLEPHRVNFRLSPGDKGVGLDLIEAVIPVEQRHVGIAAVRSGDAQLPAVDSANAMRNVEFDYAPLPLCNAQGRLGNRRRDRTFVRIKSSH
jgi:hypothetical protein